MPTRRIVPVLAAIWLAVAPAIAATDSLVALARPVLAECAITDFGSDVHVRLTITQPVPWRLHTYDDPMRLVLEFGEVDWSGADVAAILDSESVKSVSAGPAGDGWSRLVLTRAEPLQVETAGMSTTEADGHAVLKLQLTPTDAATFADQVERMVPEAAPDPDEESHKAPADDGTTVVVLDPGHGGIDPGAEAGDVTEADTMLRFAGNLAAALRGRGLKVVLTRQTDIFVPLETRLSIARRAGADVFLSLHADALAEGRASGATVYTLSAEARRTASRKLTERHERSDLLAGVDLGDSDDEIAQVLMDLARTETQPRAERLADEIVERLGAATGNLHKRPRLSAGFSVLKSPDVPSVLIEMGFVSDESDRTRLLDPVWRGIAAEGIADAVEGWLAADTRTRSLARR